MKVLLALVTLTLITAVQSRAQMSDTFAFNSLAAITSWDGSDPLSPPYPYAMGAVSLNSAFGGTWGASLDVPFQLGYLNNGYLADCMAMSWGQRNFTTGDGTHTGDAFTVNGSTTCPYYTGEYGTVDNSDNLLVGWSVVASYTVIKHQSCRYGRCTTYFTYQLVGGTGTVYETVLP
jgi:hypothetical protein